MPLIEIEEDHLVTQVGDIVPADMDDDELRECMGMLCVEAADIREQLENPARVADEDWAFRARDALRYRVKDFEACRVEAIRRGMRNLPDINPTREKARLDRIARFAKSMAHLADQERAREERKVTVLHGISPGQLRHEETMLAVQRDKTKREIAIQVEKTARHRITEAANSEKFRGKAPCFVAAAERMLSTEQRRQIWILAREMFPNDPVWADDRERAA